MGYYLYQNFSIVIYEYNLINKLLIEKVSTQLGCPYCYLLLYIKNIVVNITDFPVPFKIYKKNFLIDSHVKTSGRIY